MLVDLQHIYDPGLDRSLLAHLGWHTETARRLSAKPDFTKAVKDGFMNCLRLPAAVLVFQCKSGRHRSTFASKVAQDLAAILLPNHRVEVRHLARHSWAETTCAGQCQECNVLFHNPPRPYLRYVQQLAEELRTQMRQDYTDRCTAALHGKVEATKQVNEHGTLSRDQCTSALSSGAKNVGHSPPKKQSLSPPDKQDLTSTYVPGRDELQKSRIASPDKLSPFSPNKQNLSVFFDDGSQAPSTGLGIWTGMGRITGKLLRLGTSCQSCVNSLLGFACSLICCGILAAWQAFPLRCYFARCSSAIFSTSNCTKTILQSGLSPPEKQNLKCLGSDEPQKNRLAFPGKLRPVSPNKQNLSAFFDDGSQAPSTGLGISAIFSTSTRAKTILQLGLSYPDKQDQTSLKSDEPQKNKLSFPDQLSPLSPSKQNLSAFFDDGSQAPSTGLGIWTGMGCITDKLLRLGTSCQSCMNSLLGFYYSLICCGVLAAWQSFPLRCRFAHGIPAIFNTSTNTKTVFRFSHLVCRQSTCRRKECSQPNRAFRGLWPLLHAVLLFLRHPNQTAHSCSNVLEHHQRVKSVISVRNRCNDDFAHACPLPQRDDMLKTAETCWSFEVLLLKGGFDNNRSFAGGMDPPQYTDEVLPSFAGQLFHEFSPIQVQEEEVSLEDFPQLLLSNRSLDRIQTTPSWMGAQLGSPLPASSGDSCVPTTVLDDENDEDDVCDADNAHCTHAWPHEALPVKRRRVLEPSDSELQHLVQCQPESFTEEPLPRNTSSEAESIQLFLHDNRQCTDSNTEESQWSALRRAPFLPLQCSRYALSYDSLRAFSSTASRFAPEVLMSIDPLAHSSSSRFWDEWSLDSDGHLHPARYRGQVDDSSDVNSFLSHQVPSEVMRSLYARPTLSELSRFSDDSTHPSLNSLWYAHEDNADMPHAFEGGASEQDDFLPSKADVSKMVQKLKHIDHGMAPKQVRMLLLSDNRLLQKIHRTSDTKQLLSCITAAGKRMGVLHTPSIPKPERDSAPQTTSSSFQQMPVSKGKGKGGHEKGQTKGKGKAEVPSKAEHSEDGYKSCGKTLTNGKGKGSTKGKSASHAATFALDPHGWNVQPFDEYQHGHGAIYFTEKEDIVRSYAELSVGKQFPIAVLAPKPFQVGFGDPEPMYVEVLRTQNELTQNITVQAYLHQLTTVPVTYMKEAPRVNIQKPDVGKTSVLYLTFTDDGASAQTRLEIQQKKTLAAKHWLKSIISQISGNNDVDLLDLWNLQEVSKTQKGSTFQASVRILHKYTESLLAMSGPGKLQVNAPGSIRELMEHVWLKNEGTPLEEPQVCSVLKQFAGKHLGAFKLRGTWALRASCDNIANVKQQLGRTESPAYFLNNCCPEWDFRDIEEVLKQLRWIATVRENDRRWKGGTCTWLVRADKPPPVWGCPINFGYERRMLRITAARKAVLTSAPIPAQPAVHAFSSWNAQCKTGRHKANFSNTASKHTFAAVLTGQGQANKRQWIQTAAEPMIWQTENPFNDDVDVELLSPKRDERDRMLQDLRDENAAQRKQISELMDKMNELLQQLSTQQAVNAAQAFTGGSYSADATGSVRAQEPSHLPSS